MPQVNFDYKIDLDSRHLLEIRYRLSQLAADLFSVSEWPLKPNDFSWKFEQITPPSTLSHDIMISIHLHDFPERIASADTSAESLRDVLLVILEGAGYMAWADESPTVGILLTYGPVSWSSGSLDQVSSETHDRWNAYLCRQR